MVELQSRFNALNSVFHPLLLLFLQLLFDSKSVFDSQRLLWCTMTSNLHNFFLLSFNSYLEFYSRAQWNWHIHISIYMYAFSKKYTELKHVIVLLVCVCVLLFVTVYNKLWGMNSCRLLLSERMFVLVDRWIIFYENSSILSLWMIINSPFSHLLFLWLLSASLSLSCSPFLFLSTRWAI